MSRRPRAVLLDLDDTLLDNRGIPGAASRTCDAVAAAVGGLDPQQLRRANTAAWSDYWPTVEEPYRLGQLGGFQVSREIWRRTLHACGWTEESVARFASEQFLRLSYDADCLFADARELLAFLSQGGYRVAVVTNGPSDLQRHKLRILGLEDAFDAVVISGELGVAKPDAPPFLLALQRLAVEPADAWHIGDSLTTDVAGARAVGMFAMWLNRTGLAAGDGGSHPDVEITSLSEAAALLRQAQPPA